MARPIPGENYTVIKGDNLWNLAMAAYGDPWLWEDIFNANELQLTPNTPNKWGYIMHPGDVIWIPGDRLKDELKEVTIEEKDRNAMTIIIDGEEIPVTSGRIIKAMDTPADGCTVSTYFDPMSEIHQRIFKPGKFQKAEVFLANDLQLSGKLYTPKTESTVENGSSVSLKIFSKTVDLIDSTSKPPYERKDITLQERITELAKPKGITVIWNVTAEDRKFKKVKTKKTERIFDHISKLAKQRSVVISSNEKGDLVCEDITSTGTVGELTEGSALLRTVGSEWDGRKMFSYYVAYGTGPKKNVKAFARNPDVPTSRMIGFDANDSDEDDIQSAADFQKNSSIADALTLQIPVASWYAPNDELWKPNTLVTLISPTLFLPNGFTFLIKQVEFIFVDSGSTALLYLVPPAVYTDEELINPWA